MSRSHGELFLLADRKNRMERVRLDRQLKGMDKECARNEFLIERQQRALIGKLRGVTMTTGHSDKALPPDGPSDNAYDKSKYTLSRLSEKRLMEWKVRERQLEKFLWQNTTRPASSPAPRIRPRPPCPPSERSASRTSAGGSSAASAGVRVKPRVGRIRPATAVLQREGSKPRRRCASAVSFSSRTRMVSHGDVNSFSDADEEEEGKIVEDDKSGHDGDEVFLSRLRSLSMVSLHQHYAQHQSSRRSIPKPRLSEASSRLDIFEAFKEKPMNAPLNTAEVIEKFKTSAKNYEEFIRAHSVPETKFFVTKDSVIMTDGRQQKCKELRASHSLSDLTDKPPKPHSGHHPSSDSKDLASHADRMSLSSVSSDDFADSVFLGHEDHTKEDCELPDTTLVQSEQKTSPEDLKQPDIVSDNQIKTEGHTSMSKQNDFIQDKDDQQMTPPTRERHSSEQKTVSCQSVKFAMEGENCQDKNNEVLVPTVSVPTKKLNTVNKKNRLVKDESEDVCSKHTRRHSCHPGLRPGPCRSRESDRSRAHSVSVERETSDRSTSAPQTFLMRRRQKTPSCQYPSSTSATDQNSVMSAMTITPLLTKETSQVGAVTNKQNESSVCARRASSASAKPPRPSSSSHTHPKLNIPSQQIRHQPSDPITSTSSQQSRDLNTDTKPTNPDHQRSHSDRNISTSSQQNRNPPPRTKANLKQLEDDEDEDPNTGPEELRPASQWRRDLELEEPAGLRSRVSSLGTVLKAAMVFSKAARKKALSDLVQENNVHTHEAIRKERLRTLQSRTSVLTKIVAQFPVQGND